jgi:hypothetical protein
MAAVKLTNIDAELHHIAGPQGRQWGFVYSTCIPEHVHLAESQHSKQLQQSGLDVAKLAQVLSSVPALLLHL